MGDWSRPRHVEIFRNPEDWEDWPYLPLIKETEQSLDVGVILDMCPSTITEPYRKLTRVWLVDRKQAEVHSHWPTTEHVDYPSAGAIWEDGWRAEGADSD